MLSLCVKNLILSELRFGLVRHQTKKFGLPTQKHRVLGWGEDMDKPHLPDHLQTKSNNSLHTQWCCGHQDMEK